MIFMVPEAKNALGRVPRLNEEYFGSRSFYSKHGYKEYAPGMMKKEF